MIINTVKFEKLIKSCSSLAIVGHINPDGDCIGSTTALFHYASSTGIDARIILPGELPYTLEFLNPKGEDRITIFKNNPSEAADIISRADTIVCIDLNGPSRSGEMEPLLRASTAKKILIDHHPGPETEFFDLVFSRTDISSASELLFWILYNTSNIAGDLKRMPMAMCQSLYCGMVTDTNNFSNSVYPSTFEMASLLIKRGVDKDRLQEKILSSYSISRMRLMGLLLKEKMKYVAKYHAAYIILDEKTKHEHRFQKGDSEGFVNLPLKAKKVRISALFTEDTDNNHIRVSIRSKGHIDVNAFARACFNGGGHVNASGGKLFIPVNEIPAYFEESLKNFFGA